MLQIKCPSPVRQWWSWMDVRIPQCIHLLHHWILSWSAWPSSGCSRKPHDIDLQPKTSPISQKPLGPEAKGIYAGLVMVEAKCIEVDNRQAVLCFMSTMTFLGASQHLSESSTSSFTLQVCNASTHVASRYSQLSWTAFFCLHEPYVVSWHPLLYKVAITPF